MPDFRVADSAPEHPKLRAAGLSAAGLWALAGAYSMRELTDGWVPEYWVSTWPAGKRHAATLVRVGLWATEDRDGVAGYRFHDWFDVQRAASQIKEERHRGRQRAAKSRRTHTVRSPERSGERSGERTGERNGERNGEASGGRAPNVRDSLPLSLTLPPGGHLGGGRPETNARPRDGAPPSALTSEKRPPGRCSRHRDLDADPGPCRGCGKARERAETWDIEHERARLAAIRACACCDVDGWRIDPDNRHRGPLSPAVRCDHTAWSRERLETSAS